MTPIQIAAAIFVQLNIDPMSTINALTAAVNNVGKTSDAVSTHVVARTLRRYEADGAMKTHRVGRRKRYELNRDYVLVDHITIGDLVASTAAARRRMHNREFARQFTSITIEQLEQLDHDEDDDGPTYDGGARWQ